MIKNNGNQAYIAVRQQINVIIGYLGSMKLGLVLFLLLGAAAAAGSFLSSWQQYYKSPLFYFLLAVMALNLGICTKRRAGTIVSALRQSPDPPFGKIPADVPLTDNFTLPSEFCKTINYTRHLLKRRRYQVMESKVEKEYWLSARKGHIGLIGSLLTHTGFLVVLSGVFLGSILGSSGFINVPVGDMFNVSDVLGKGNFSVRVDDFKIEQYPGGYPSQYISRVSVIEGTDVTGEYQISINKPLNYNGIKFIQSTWGTVLKLVLKSREAESALMVPVGKLVTIPGTDYKIKFNERTGKVIYSIYRGGKQVGVGAAGINQIVQVVEGVYFSVTGATLYTGLKVKTDPGIPLVWSGCGLLLTGIIVSLYWRPRYLWVILKDNGNKVQIQMGGRSPKNNLGFSDEFSRLAENIKMFAGERKTDN